MKGRAVWIVCGTWALLFVLAGLGGVQAGRASSGLGFIGLGLLPGAAWWAWPHLRELGAGAYWGTVAAAALLLLLLGGGLPLWLVLALPVALIAGYVWLNSGSSAPPTGAYAGRWMRPKEAQPFAICEDEEGQTIPAAWVPPIPGQPTPANKRQYVGSKPYSVSSIQGELGHVTVMAPTRSGKGLLLTSQLLTWKQSAIVLDIKGENWERTSAHRATLGPVYVLSPEGKGARFDPIAELLELGSDRETALMQAATILLRPEKEAQPIFPLTALPALRAGMRVAYALGEPVLPWVYSLSRLGLQGYVRQVQAHAQHAGDWQSVDDLTQFLGRPLAEVKEGQWDEARWMPAQAWPSLTAALGRVCTEGVLAMTSGRDFTAADLKRRSGTVYLQWREDVGAGVRDVFSLVALALLKGLGRYADDHRAEKAQLQEVLFIIDEAGVFEVPELPTLMATLAGRQVWVCPYFQGVNQIKEMYGDQADQTVISNASAVVWYPTGETDAGEYVERYAGKTSVEVSSTSSGTSREFGALVGTETKSTSRSTVDRPLITASEFSQLGEDVVLVQFKNKPWLKARPVRWFEEPRWAGRAADQGVNGEKILFSLNAYRQRITPQPQRQYAEPAASASQTQFYKPDEN